MPNLNDPQGQTDPSHEGGGEATVSAEEVLKMQQGYENHLKSLQQQNMKLMDDFNVTIQSLSQNRQESPGEQTPIGLSPEEIKNVIETGEGADVLVNRINETINSQVTSGINKLTKEVIDPIRQEGAFALKNLATTQARTDSTMPYFNKFEKDINEQLQLLAPIQQHDPRAMKAAHDLVVGRNLEVIFKEKQEEMLRQQNQQDPGGSMGPGTGNRGPGGSPQSDQILPMEQALPQESLAHVQKKGWNGDQLARASGFTDWNDMQEFNRDEDPDKKNYFLKKEEERRAAHANA